MGPEGIGKEKTRDENYLINSLEVRAEIRYSDAHYVTENAKKSPMMLPLFQLFLQITNNQDRLGHYPFTMTSLDINHLPGPAWTLHFVPNQISFLKGPGLESRNRIGRRARGRAWSRRINHKNSGFV